MYGRNRGTCNVSTRIIEQVKQFSYLKVQLSSDKYYNKKEDTKARLSGRLKNLIQRNKHVNLGV